MSPNLFNIFINDLVDIFDDNCGAFSMGNFNLNCLIYADDVILISQSESGLQNCLNKLEKYCELWCLDINIDKTKSIVFNESGKLLPYSFVSMGNFNLNCLIYADDVILISQSESGLQNCLNKLEKYCELWCLDINIDKTKSVVFNESGKLLPY